MSHLPPANLHTWRDGDRISSAVLNHDFRALHGLIETAAALALEPDPDGARALEEIAYLKGRLARLERDAAIAREPAAPLAAFTALTEQVERLAKREAGTALKADADEMRAIQRGLAGRVSMLEGHPAPPAPSVEEFAALREEAAQAQAEARFAWQQLAGVRAELAGVRKLVAEDQRRTKYVPLSALAELLKHMDAFRKSTAAEDVATMREEVGRLHRLIADTDRRAALHRMFTPRAAFAYLLRRVERLEGRPS